MIAEQYAEKILQGEVVSVIHGRAEFGPRALGNRSLLCTPTDDNIEKLNKFKGRVDDSPKINTSPEVKAKKKGWFK